MKKLCSDCIEEKELNEFYTNDKHGKYSLCKECRDLRSKKYSKNSSNKKQNKKEFLEWYNLTQNNEFDRKKEFIKISR